MKELISLFSIYVHLLSDLTLPTKSAEMKNWYFSQISYV